MLKDILNSFVNFTYPALLITLLIVPAWLFIREDDWQKKLMAFVREHRWQVLFFFCLAFVLTATVISRPTTNPFRSVFSHFGLRDEKWNNEILQNIILFIPVGFLLMKAFPAAGKKKPWLRALLFSSGLTLFIEFSQLVFWLGEFQFSDLLHNTMGGMIGYGLWASLECLKRKDEKHGA